MRLLFQSHDLQELHGAKDLLEANGIPAFVSFQDSQTALPLGNGMGLWVYLNEQADDARKLLENPGHRVEQPIDVQAFRAEIERQQSPGMANGGARDRISGWLGALALLALMALIGWRLFVAG